MAHRSYPILGIALVGETDVGKSSMLTSFKGEDFITGRTTTISVEFAIKVVDIGDKRLKLQIWDTSGLDRTITSFIRNISGIMVVYDTTHLKSFLCIRRVWIDFIREHAPADVVTMFVGNKSDLVKRREVTETMGRELAKDCGAMFVEVSAKTGSNINKAFLELTEQITLCTHQKSLRKIKRSCPNCNESFTDPKLLQCFHVYCKKCIDQMVVQEMEGKSSIACPACQHPTILPFDNAKDLVTVSHVTRQNERHEMLKKLNNPQRMSCEQCSRRRNIAVCFCRQCSKFVCSQCSDAHKKWAELQNHVILTIDEAKGNMELMYSDEPENCFKHASEKLNLYCETCGVLICQHCTVQMHKDHNYCVIADTMGAHKKQLLDSVSTVEDQLSRTTSSMSSLVRAQEENQKLSENLKSKIRSTFQDLRKILDETEVRLVTEVDKVIEPKIENLEVKKQQIYQFRTQCTSCMDFVLGAVHSGKETELLKSKHSVMKEVQNLEKRFDPDFCLSFKQENVGFALSQDLAKVIDDSLHLYQATVSGKGTSIAEVGKLETVRLEVCDIQNQPIALPISTIEGTLVPSFKGGDTLQCDVTQVDSGKYDLTYQPTPANKFNHLNITIDGKHVLGSPFDVTIVNSLNRSFTKSIDNLNGPRGVAVSYEEVFVCESDSHSVSVFSPTGEKIRTITGENSKHGPLGTVRGVAKNWTGIVVTDSDNCLVRRFSKDGEELATSEPLQFQCPNGVCMKEFSDSVYVVDHLAQCVKRLNYSDLSVASTFGSPGKLDGQFNFPFDVALDRNKNVYVTDTENHRVQVFTPGGKYLRQFGAEGTEPGQLKGPIGICIDRNCVFVGELYNKRVSVFTLRGDFVTLFGSEGNEPGQFDGPFGLAVNDGVLYVSDFGNKRVQLFS